MQSPKHPYTYRQCDPQMITAQLLQCLTDLETFVTDRGYRSLGSWPTASSILPTVAAATQTRRKRLLKWVERLRRRPNLRMANQFLHLLCKQLPTDAPETPTAHIALSERELAIQAARRAYAQARQETEAKRLAYIAEKGDFYKR